MVTAFIVAFCQIVIAFLFVLSFVGKLRAVAAFQTAVTNFKILPPEWSKIAAWTFLFGELAVIVLITLGGNMLLIGFLAASALLVIFSVALGVTLIRRLKIQCNCFGQQERLISPYDLVRNGVFIICSFIGIVLLRIGGYQMVVLSFTDKVLAGLIGIAFVMVFTNLSEIVQLYNQPTKLG